MKLKVLIAAAFILSACKGTQQAGDGTEDPNPSGRYLCSDTIEDPDLDSVRIEYAYDWENGVGASNQEWSVFDSEGNELGSTTERETEDGEDFYVVLVDVGAEDPIEFILYPDTQEIKRGYADGERVDLDISKCNLIEE